jgi:2-amino-4-hydroxy-6-hydroxymethyldihydropteridine diphosphokinase
MAEAYLGLGGNLGDSAVNLRTAVERLALTDGITVTGISKFYRTAPVGGPSGQPHYINAAIAVVTDLTPRQLLDYCLSVECHFGRVRRERWGPRTVDIDILLYGSLVIEQPGLSVPHPMLRERLFALIPLCEVAPPDLEIPPDGIRLRDVVRAAKSALEPSEFELVVTL